MSDRTDLPKIKPQEQPSLLNHEIGKWGFWGALAAAVPAGFANLAGRARLGFGISAAGTLVGALYGSFTGKAQQEKEQQTGRVVKDPGYWNKGILTGMAVDTLIRAPLAAFGRPLPNFIAWPLYVALPVIGSIMRNNSLQRDFDAAVEVRNQQQALQQAKLQQVARQQAPAAGYTNSVSAAEAAELEKRLQPEAAGHADKLAQSATQELAAAQRV